MPLSQAGSRREIHHRNIDMKAYARDDGYYDIESRLVDTKPFDFIRPGSSIPLPAGDSLHDLQVRMTVDEDFIVCDIEAASDVTPWAICKQAESTLKVLIGERIERGWSAKVKERLRGAASCTHLMEMLIPLATTALQGIRAVHGKVELEPESKIDSCYAYGRERDVVKMLWPEHQEQDTERESRPA